MNDDSGSKGRMNGHAVESNKKNKATFSFAIATQMKIPCELTLISREECFKIYNSFLACVLRMKTNAVCKIYLTGTKVSLHA